MRIIPTPGSRIQSSDTLGVRRQTHTASAPSSSQPANGDDNDDALPLPEPDPMPYPLVSNPLPEGEDKDIVAEEAAAAQAGRVYLRWDGDIFDRLVEFWRQEDFKRLQWTNMKNRASETGGSMHTGGSTTYTATRERMALEIGRTPSVVVGQVFRWLQDAGGPEPTSIDEEAIWLQIFGGRKKGRIYGKGVVPAHTVPLIIRDDYDTASGPPDVREQAEANRQRVAQVEAICDEKMRSGGSGAAAFTAMLPPPPPPPDGATSPSQHDDDLDYV
ncbi:hypothetical protein PIB30_045558 [Stylosanthes scabra]|uniref:Uncharacterized protein n=1 Tax=Stylosanthes scabra TaxID=79078 RepID=A0ABU6WG55_9FABA|nr:hypothetical protein [Stylosanthes scabra]